MCILTECIYENFIKTRLYGEKIMGYNKKSRTSGGAREGICGPQACRMGDRRDFLAKIK